MKVFEAKPKQWGNSIGVIIPKEIVESENISPHKSIEFAIFENTKGMLVKEFGTLKTHGTPTQQIMDEIDEGYDD